MISGLFSIVKYPNYLGEILVWVGIFLSSSIFLSGWEYASAISPLWIILLLTRISGIPLLEQSQNKRYMHLESFREWVRDTKKLIPGIYIKGCDNGANLVIAELILYCSYEFI